MRAATGHFIFDLFATHEDSNALAVPIVPDFLPVLYNAHDNCPQATRYRSTAPNDRAKLTSSVVRGFGKN